MITTRTAAETQVSYSLPLWAMPTAVSLDAPLVAVLWQWFFARSLGLELHPLASVLLFATVWLIYAADRLLDSLNLDLGKKHTYRHAFSQYYRTQLSIIWVLIFLPTAGLSLFELGPQVFHLGLIAVGLTLIYGLGIHTFKPLVSHSKELQIGLIFAFGTLLAFSGQLPLSQLLVPGISFALLCSFNCYTIALFERNTDAQQRTLSLAQHYGRLEPLLKILLPLFILATACLSFWVHTPLYFMMSLSALGLRLLISCQARLTAEPLRVLADAMLLTPLLLLCFW
ncbi:MAG: hypothetical protein KC422_21005 [Trueperaceae bacterium]|nr:hypothetical protein [Trueperaceae bacterium]